MVAFTDHNRNEHLIRSNSIVSLSKKSISITFLLGGSSFVASPLRTNQSFFCDLRKGLNLEIPDRWLRLWVALCLGSCWLVDVPRSESLRKRPIEVELQDFASSDSESKVIFNVSQDIGFAQGFPGIKLDSSVIDWSYESRPSVPKFLNLGCRFVVRRVRASVFASRSRGRFRNLLGRTIDSWGFESLDWRPRSLILRRTISLR